MHEANPLHKHNPSMVLIPLHVQARTIKHNRREVEYNAYGYRYSSEEDNARGESPVTASKVVPLPPTGFRWLQIFLQVTLS